ncbi:STAS-like domain-containing protein [Roseivivax lentus]|uniref:STAS-like domain-containing protein n=1 Tax=Roseivivax lentus TaxID=633194 RepID=UPI000970D9ED|nr:STAS-like domain-containing protein [Roseivivax lentus]
MVIVVKQIVSSCDTSSQGAEVYSKLRDSLRMNVAFTVDFIDIPNVTSSFVNTAFVPLLTEFSFSEVKARMSVINANRQVASMLRDRMLKESKRMRLAA